MTRGKLTSLLEKETTTLTNENETYSNPLEPSGSRQTYSMYKNPEGITQTKLIYSLDPTWLLKMFKSNNP